MIMAAPPILAYSANDGLVVVRVDAIIVDKTSGILLDPLPDGSHTVRVTAADAAGNIGSAQVTFTSTGADSSNVYCSGTEKYLVGPSSFTSGIIVPTSGNAVLIASPENGASITGAKVIVKGAMDTTIPVNSVMVQVIGNTGTASYPAQVNGKYFAAKVPVTTDTYTIKAIATDRDGTPHESSILVYPETQTGTVELAAAPSVGIPTLKQNGRTTLDVNLDSTASLANPVASYTWDLDGSGTEALTCFSHSGVSASYQQLGLYLSKVTVRDRESNTYTDTAIVNVIDPAQMDSLFKQIWNGMKNALIAGDATGALVYINSSSQQKYSEAFTMLQSNIAQIAEDMQDIERVYIRESVVKYRIRRNQMIDGQNETVTYYIYFMKDQDGQWRIDDF